MCQRLWLAFEIFCKLVSARRPNLTSSWPPNTNPALRVSQISILFPSLCSPTFEFSPLLMEPYLITNSFLLSSFESTLFYFPEIFSSPAPFMRLYLTILGHSNSFNLWPPLGKLNGGKFMWISYRSHVVCVWVWSHHLVCKFGQII